MSILDELKETDLIQSVYDETKNRMRSIMWGTFVISWCVWNWEPIYTTIFVDQKIILEQTKLIKIEYILNHYYSWKHIGNALWNLIKLFIGPSISTYLIVYQISKLDLIFFKQSYKNKIGQKNAALDLDRATLKKEEKIVDEKKVILEKKEKNIDIQKKIQKDLTDEEKWSEEFEEVKSKKIFSDAMIVLRECIYEHRGRILVSNFQEERFEMDSSLVGYLHTRGIIEFEKNSNKSIIELTEKGKFLLKRYFDLLP